MLSVARLAHFVRGRVAAESILAGEAVPASAGTLAGGVVGAAAAATATEATRGVGITCVATMGFGREGALAAAGHLL